MRDHPEETRFEVLVDGRLAGIATYHLSGGTLTLIHTEVDDAYEGQGLAGQLARTAFDTARQRGLSVVTKCPYMAKWVRSHREYADLVPERRHAEFGL